MGAGLASPAPARVRPACGDRGSWLGARCDLGASLLEAGLARRRPSPFLGGPVPEGGWRDPGSRATLSLPVAALARAAGRLPPGPARSWSHLAGAGPARPPEAAGGGVFAEGSLRGAGRAWPRQGQPPTWSAGARGAGTEVSGGDLGEPGQGLARGLRAEGDASGESSQRREKVATRRRASGRQSSSRGSCLLPWVLNSCFVGAASPPPPARFSSFCFQIMLCLAFW